MIDFMMGLSVLVNLKNNNYDSILVIVKQLTKIVYYNQVKVIIDTPELAKVIRNIVVCHDSLLDLIIADKESLSISKF